MSQTMTRTELLLLDEEHLVRQCRCDVCRGTGPGGQKRNKTSSAVQLTHVQTGFSAYDDQERSQQINKHRAAQKLRLEIALNLREPPTAWQGVVPNPKNPQYALWVAVLMDNLQSANFSVADAAKSFGSSTGKLVREMARTPALWQRVNKERTDRGFSPLRPNA